MLRKSQPEGPHRAGWALSTDEHLIHFMQKCLTCACDFAPPKGELARGNGLYCSRMCSARRPRVPRQNKPNCVCAVCSVEFYRPPAKQHSKLLFCSVPCKNLAARVSSGPKYASARPSFYGSDNITKYRKTMLRSGMPQVCADCGYDKYPIHDIHHIDCDRTNNKLSNLVWLCPTCHETRHYLEQSGRWYKRRKNT